MIPSSPHPTAKAVGFRGEDRITISAWNKALTPEPTDPRPGYHEKDKVENYLHDQVCDHGMPLEEAQLQIARNWLGVYEGL